MYDTVILRKDISNSQREYILKNATETRIKKMSNGNETIQCRIDFMWVLFLNGMVRISVSLPALKYGHNLYPVNRFNVRECICKMEEILKINLADATVSRIDVAQNIIVDSDCRIYFNSLLYKPKFNKSVYPTGVSFSRQSEHLCFYDKNVQMKMASLKMGEENITEFTERNILRYEYRIKGHLNRLLDRRETVLKDLLNRSFSNQLVRRWISNYLSIDKAKRQIERNLRTVPEFKNYLAFEGSNNFGGQAGIREIIDLNKRLGIYQNPSQPHRIVKMVDELYTNGVLCTDNKFINELNQKVWEAAFLNFT